MSVCGKFPIGYAGAGIPPSAGEQLHQIDAVGTPLGEIQIRLNVPQMLRHQPGSRFAIVRGCAGMTDLTQSLCSDHGLPVLDGVGCAITLCEGLVRLGLKTSRLGGYTPPGLK